MTIETFIRAMPKVELHVHLEAGWRKDTLLMLAEENEIRENLKHFANWVRLIDAPDFARLPELIRMLSTWLQQPEDLTRIVYDLGVALFKQNVRYAEVSVNPTLYTHMGLSYESFMDALNDGRDRVQRGWGVRMAWILTMPREEARRSDEILRFAGTVTGRKAGIVGIGLQGTDNPQPVMQFERLFKGAEKKDVARIPHAGELPGAEILLDTLQLLNPTRIIEGWQAVDAPDVLQLLVERNLPLDLCMARALCMGELSSYTEYPLRRLLDAGVRVVLGSDMPTFFKTGLSDEYLAAVEHAGLTLEQLETVALNAVHASLLSSDVKETMLKTFTADYARLRAEHVAPQTT